MSNCSVKRIIVEPEKESVVNQTRFCPPRVHSQLKERMGERGTSSLQSRWEWMKNDKCYGCAKEKIIYSGASLGVVRLKIRLSRIIWMVQEDNVIYNNRLNKITGTKTHIELSHMKWLFVGQSSCTGKCTWLGLAHHAWGYCSLVVELID